MCQRGGDSPYMHCTDQNTFFHAEKRGHMGERGRGGEREKGEEKILI